MHPVSLIQLQRLDTSSHSTPKPLWLIWIGLALPSLSTVWQQYLRRFAIDHWYRFAKQRLHWTLPQLATPEQSERWSDLMPLLTWQLWLARLLIQDSPLPWQKSSPDLSPGRTANAFAQVLALIGTPAPAPKPRGKSPGWTPGQPRSRRIPIQLSKSASLNLNAPLNSPLNSRPSLSLYRFAQSIKWLGLFSLPVSLNFSVKAKPGSRTQEPRN